MAAAVAALAQNIFQRQRDRLRSDRVDSHDHEENNANDSIENDAADDVIDADTGEEEEGSFLNDQQPSENNNNNARTQDESESSNTNNEGVQSFVARTTMTLAELEEEVRGRPFRFVFFLLGSFITHTTIIVYFFRSEQQREVARRRSSACFLFAVFVLFRMWIYAIGSSGT
jgi:hypothetical protein